MPAPTMSATAIVRFQFASVSSIPDHPRVVAARRRTKRPNVVMAAPKSQYAVDENPISEPMPMAIGEIENVNGMPAIAKTAREGKRRNWSRSKVITTATASDPNRMSAPFPPEAPALSVEAAALPIG